MIYLPVYQLSEGHVPLFATSWSVAHQVPSVYGIFTTRILEWVAISSSRGSSQPRDRTHVSCISTLAGLFFTTEPLGKPSVKVRCY